MAIEKIRILGAVLELPAKQHCQFSPFGPLYEVNGLDWQCYLAGSSKTALKIFIFSIVMGAEKFILCYFCPHISWVYYFSLSQCENKENFVKENM